MLVCVCVDKGVPLIPVVIDFEVPDEIRSSIQILKHEFLNPKKIHEKYDEYSIHSNRIWTWAMSNGIPVDEYSFTVSLTEIVVCVKK